MKPNRPVPVIQPTVVATALPNATSIKIVPWIRSSHRRNVAILEVGWGVVKRLAFIAIFSPPPNVVPLSDLLRFAQAAGYLDWNVHAKTFKAAAALRSGLSKLQIAHLVSSVEARR
jgi:hypothetical protein